MLQREKQGSHRCGSAGWLLSLARQATGVRSALGSRERSLDDFQGLRSSSLRVDLKMLWRCSQASTAMEQMRMISALCCGGPPLKPMSC